MHHQYRYRRTHLNAEIPVRNTVQGVHRYVLKPEQFADLLSVYRISRRRKRTASERHSVHTLVCILESADITDKHLRISHNMMCKCDRLRTLQMRVARHNGVKIFLRNIAENTDKLSYHRDYLVDFIFEIHSYVKCDLIVSASSRVQTLARVAEALCKLGFNKHMNVFRIRVKEQLAVIDIRKYAFKSCDYLFALGLFNNAAVAKHFSVRH